MNAYTFSMFDYRSITCTEYPTQDFDLQAFIPRALSTYMTNGHITQKNKVEFVDKSQRQEVQRFDLFKDRNPPLQYFTSIILLLLLLAGKCHQLCIVPLLIHRFAASYVGWYSEEILSGLKHKCSCRSGSIVTSSTLTSF